MVRRRLLAAALATLTFALSLTAPAPDAPDAAAASGCGRGGLDEAALDAAFATPGLGSTATMQGFGGGDYPHAYPLPDGRILWLFQDLHFSNDDDLRNDVPDGSPTNAAHNAGLVQQGTCWTVLGGRGLDVLGDHLTIDSTRWFWPMDGEIGIDGNLWIFVAEMSNPDGTGAMHPAVPVRSWIAILDRRTLQPLYFEPAPDTSNKLFGWSVVSTDRWSYLYSHCYRQFANPGNSPSQFDASCTSRTYLARVPRGDFAHPPEYWNGTGWTTSAASAAAVVDKDTSHAMSVQWFGDVFVSVTKRDEWWGGDLVIERAPAPQGPWTTVATRSVVGAMKCSTCGNYGAFLMPWLDSRGRMVVGLSSGADFEMWRSNASLYRPTFHTFDLPGPTTTSAASPPAFELGAASSGFLPVDPVRLVDTRAPGAAFGRLVPGTRAELDLRDRMPAGATAVALNLTTDRSAQDGWVRAFPCDAGEPPTSNVNPAVGRVVTNAAIVPVGDGRLCVTSLGPTDLVVDLNGWLTVDAPAGLVARTERLADTRTGTGGAARLDDGETMAVRVAAPGSAVVAVSLGVTAVDPAADGYVTAWPCGTTMPVVSNLNPQAGVTRPNLVNVRVGADGRVCLATMRATDLVVDLLGEYRTDGGARYAPIGPRRLLDSRAGGRPTHPSNMSDLVALGSVAAAQVNLTATDTEAAGYLSAYPCLAQAWPGTSNANYVAGETTATAALMSPGRGYGCVFSSAVTHLVVDLFGVWR
ncbi:MAG: DUF4185 domain-containing protein [Acidimicrobiales bacterium]|nr:DUF4185 domain-containing protein [Acidimicrobiales bacterium]MCB9392434.1 DUF4185 domain-containing protein [Acidimicrobiaceae bacterium]